MNQNINKEVLIQVMLYLLQDVEDKKKTLNALKELLSTDINEQEAVTVSINAVYERYVRDVNTYLEIFQGLGIDIQGQAQAQQERTESVEIKEPPKTKKEIEVEQKEEEFELDLKDKEAKLEKDVEQQEQEEFKNKMKKSDESLLDRLNLLKKNQ